MSEPLAAQTAGKKTFTILHTKDLHSNFIGMTPAALSGTGRTKDTIP